MAVRSARNGWQRYRKCLEHVPSVPCVCQVHGKVCECLYLMHIVCLTMQAVLQMSAGVL